MSTQRAISFITHENFEKLLDTFERTGKVYIPIAAESRDGKTHFPYGLRTAGKKFEYIGFRPSNPLKTFLFSGRMKVAEYPSSTQEVQEISPEPATIVGAAACDVESLKSLDAVFLQDEFTDVFYRVRRNNTFIISADCTEPRATCLCTLAGISPYSEDGFDLNMSRLQNGFIIEAGSEKGEQVINSNKALFTGAGDELISERERQRSETAGKVGELNIEYELSKKRKELLGIQRESGDWYEHVRACIECGACLFSCPTCHCFLLYDQLGESDTFQRIKEWDVCSYAGYSRMAGGSSPRSGLMERFRHRYLHKFEYFPENFGFEACSGCGRCIEGCMGKIDMRKVLKALDKSTAGAEKQ